MLTVSNKKICEIITGGEHFSLNATEINVWQIVFDKTDV